MHRYSLLIFVPFLGWFLADWWRQNKALHRDRARRVPPPKPFPFGSLFRTLAALAALVSLTALTCPHGKPTAKSSGEQAERVVVLIDLSASIPASIREESLRWAAANWIHPMHSTAAHGEVVQESDRDPIYLAFAGRVRALPSPPPSLIAHQDTVTLYPFRGPALAIDPAEQQRDTIRAKELASSHLLRPWLEQVAAMDLNPERTDLAGALKAARLVLESQEPDGLGQGTIILLTDGHHTGSPQDLEREIRRLVATGIQVNIHEAWPANLGDIRVESISFPDSVRPGVPVQGHVVLSSLAKADATLQVIISGQRDPSFQSITSLPGDHIPKLIPLNLPPLAEGKHRIHAIVSAQHPHLDVIPENNRASTLVHVLGSPQALVITERPDLPPLLEAVPPSTMTLHRAGPAVLGHGHHDLQQYDLILLDGIPAWRLPQGWDSSLARLVASGTGLWTLGGPQAYGLGGWNDTLLDSLLPVSSTPPRGEGNLAMVILIDKSGSMGGRTEGWERLLLAKATLRSLVDAFYDENDLIAILAFDSKPHPILPLTRVGRIDPESLDTGSVTAGGGTDPGPAMELAHQWLEASGGRMRHILLISDGIFQDNLAAEEKVGELNQAGIRVSTMAMGAQADLGRMEALALLGAGSFQQVKEILDLPDAVRQEILQLPADGLITSPTTPVPGPDLPSIMSSPLHGIPTVHGYQKTVLRRNAHLWIQTPKGIPIFAGGTFGAGRVAITTVDLHGDGTDQWSGWDSLEPLLGATATWTARGARFPFDIRLKALSVGTQVTLVAMDTEGAPMENLDPLAAFLCDGARGQEEALMIPSAPGLYHTRFSHCPDNTFGEITITLGTTLVGQRWVAPHTSQETASTGNHRETIDAITLATGGDQSPAPGPLMRSSPRSPPPGVSPPSPLAGRFPSGPLGISALLFALVALLAALAWDTLYKIS